ncbi:NAD-binding protein, partial [Pseudanabaenaceae cyanobacterium LEGE 13415]|nr:NAD-binding protein [Pseudanabaenaceae cyanobacterium LEGE 13415]
MNLSSLGFFHSLRSDHKNRQFAVIGLGRFGRAVCSSMHNSGYEVLAVDSDRKRVDQALNDRIATHARQI